MLAAVGPLMTEAAGEVADGVLCPRLLDRALPARGDAAGARAGLREGGPDARGLRDHRARFRRRPRHRGGDRRGRRLRQAADRLLRLHPRLPAGARAARVGRAAGRAEGDDQARRVGPDGRADRRRGLHTFAVVGTPEEAIAEVKRRYGDICTRITLTLPDERDEERWRAVRLSAPIGERSPAGRQLWEADRPGPVADRRKRGERGVEQEATKPPRAGRTGSTFAIAGIAAVASLHFVLRLEQRPRRPRARTPGRPARVDHRSRTSSAG